MTLITTESFSNDIELQGIMVDKKNLLNVGFDYKNHTYNQKSSIKQIQTGDIIFETEIVLHLNSEGNNTPCPLCQKEAKHLVRCEAFDSTELSLVVLDAAIQKLEENAVL